MLSAEQLQLITAAVDGELSAVEARAFRRLLDTTPQARALYAKLQADSVRVRALPQVAPPANLVAKVMARVADTPAPSTAPARTQPAPDRYRRVRALAPFALAASVLVAVTVGSFAFFNDDGTGQQTAKQPWGNILPTPADSSGSVPSPREQHQPDPDAVARTDMSPVPPVSPHPKEVTPNAVAVAPEPRLAHPDLIASPVLPKLPPFDLVQVRVPFLRAVAELERDDARQELLDELRREPGFPHRFDVFVRSTARGVDVFQNAARASGLKVFADATTLERLKKKQVHSVVIYTETLTAAELAEFFAKLTVEDKKFSPRVCDALHATPVVRADELDLKAVLGTDAGLFKRPATGQTGQGNNRKPDSTEPKSVSDGTIDMVTDTLTKPQTKPTAKTAILLTWQPGPARTNPAMSKELSQFLTKRADRKPGAIPAIIVIRPAG
jgi:anti-sigma factor RsiW